jgi:hypothetical protein
MMDSTLERVSISYRDGYRAGESEARCSPAERTAGSFSHYDYMEGYSAGANDHYWSVIGRGDACDIKTRRCGYGSVK